MAKLVKRNVVKSVKAWWSRKTLLFKGWIGAQACSLVTGGLLVLLEGEGWLVCLWPTLLLLCVVSYKAFRRLVFLAKLGAEQERIHKELSKAHTGTKKPEVQ